MWVRKRDRFLFGVRQNPFPGTIGSAGEPFPKDTQGSVALHNNSRTIRLWLYDPAKGDFTLNVGYDDMDIEQGHQGLLAGGRFNPVGVPALAMQGGMVKILVGGWEGSPPSVPSTLLRIYTFIYWE